jgi:hypothetical protein
MMPSHAASDVQKGNSPSAGTAIVILGIVVIALLLLTVVVAFVMTVYQFPRLGRLRDAELLAQLFSNLVVACYAFPAFKRTKKREFLALGFAALIFAYGALFSVVALAAFSPGSRSRMQWYYAALHGSSIVGLGLYTYGIVMLARPAKASHGTSIDQANERNV